MEYLSKRRLMDRLRMILMYLAVGIVIALLLGIIG